MKIKFTSVILLIFFSLPFFGAYYVLQIQKYMVKYQVKKEMIKGMDKSQLNYFRFSLNEAKTQLQWEHAHEFEFKGEMYDVVESRSFGDSIEYWCWHDSEETELNHNLSHLLTNLFHHTPLSKQKENHIDHFLKSIVSNFKSEKPICITSQKIKWHVWNESYKWPFGYVLDKPPEIIR